MDPGGICPDETTIEQFVFGRATPERASWLEEHAATCASCRKLVATLIQLSMSSPSLALAPLRASAAPLEPGLELGRYQIRERIGVGGMGVVLSAYDPELQRAVAVKLMHPFLGDPAARWLRVTREAQLMARLSHPNVCAVHDVGLFEGQVYLVMELVQGRTLGRWLHGAARTWREIRDAYVAAGRGLAAAHAMGIVHCDFKPDNVLVGDDGRIRVTDFGLARTLEDSHAGACGGTPAYLAPELRGGNPSTPSSDQYAFCVALRAALADLRPRSWLLRALARGLSEDPAQRYPSMDALIAALTRDQRQRVPLMAGALLVGLAAVAVAVVVSRETPVEPEQLCRATSHELDGAWDSARRGELASSFGASRAPFAGAMLTTVAARLDAWAARWRELRREACVANLQGRESSTLMDVRVLCLSERRDELRAVVELLARPSDATITRAVELAYGLAPLDGCANPSLALTQQAPRDPDGWARYQELSRDLARVKTLNNAAEYTEARGLATAVVAGARALGPSRLLASALHLQAVAQTALGDAASAEATLREAGRVAEATRADDVVVSVRLARLRLLSGVRARYQELDELRADAEAAINRVGRSELDQAALLSTVGTIHIMAQSYQLAQDSLTAAAEVQARRLGDSPELASTLNALGAMQVTLGHVDEGAATLERALAIDLGLYGDAHPFTAAARVNLAAVAADRHRYAEAADVYRKALPVLERSHGEHHPHVADTLSELALVLSELHRDDEAIASATRALRIRQQLEPRPHRETARAWNELGLMNLNAKRLQAAKAALNESAAMWRALGDDTSLGHADNQIILGTLWVELHDYRQAIACHRRAHALYAKSLGPHHPRTVKLVSQLGADELLRGSTASAISLLEQAIAVQRGSDGSPAPDVPATELATTELTLARALVERGWPRDRERVRALVEAARTRLRAAGDDGTDTLAELERWVAQQGKRLTLDAR